MKISEEQIRARLPEEMKNENIDFFSGYYLDGLNVMSEGERGGPDQVVYEAKDAEDLLCWELETVCSFLPNKKAGPPKTWRYERLNAEDNHWRYLEHRHYDYNAIQDDRLAGFESLLRNLKYALPPERWEKRVQEHVRLMNFWYRTPHWDYDRQKLCFIEISDSKECDERGGPEEPRPGSVIKIVD